MKKRIVLLVAGVVAAAAIVAAVVYSRSEQSSTPTSSATGDRVTVELRALPTATIRIDGKKVGTTPINLHFPRSDREITIEATLKRQLVRMDGGKKDETYKGVRKIRLDRDHLHDFTIDTAELVDTVVTEPTPKEP